MSKAFDLILFDLDGTLVQTGPEIADAVNDLLSQLDCEPVQEALIESWIGHGTRELLVQALQSRGIDTSDAAIFDGLEDRFAGHYLNRCGTRSRLYPAVRETLEALQRAEVPCVLMTNKETRYTQEVLAAHDLNSFLADVICGDTLPVKKPNPAGVQMAMEKFGASAQRTLFVGDSSIDINTARRAGIAVWALPYGYNMGRPIQDDAPDRVIDDISALLLHPVNA
jgi:phosphoglycolate phosphatase